MRFHQKATRGAGKGEFLGVTVGDGVILPEIESKLRLATEEAGAVFEKLGYRGFFDVDFILTKEHAIYAIESNMRRTGGTHVYDLWRRLKRDHSKQKALQIFSHDSFVYSMIDAHSPSEILDKAKDLLYPINGTSTGVVISLMNIEDSILGYMVIGRDKEEIEKIRQALISAVSAKD